MSIRREADEPYGPEAHAAWDQAAALVKEHRYAEARSVRLYRSDYLTLEKLIQREEERLRK